jgi:phytoene synthase
MKKVVFDFGKIDTLNLESSYIFCEDIAKKKNPFLYHVSKFFHDKTKFNAFCSSYASMRILDDYIDNIKNRNRLSLDERNFYLAEVNRWEGLIIDCRNGKTNENPILLALSDTFQNFDLPLTPWNNLANAMRWDVEKSGFSTFNDFLEYCEGAAIAPATVFMHLLMAKSDGTKYVCSSNSGDPYIYAKNLAIFCYLTHILRDISRDLQSEEKGFIYLPAKDLKDFKIQEDDLWEFKYRQSINGSFEKLMKHQLGRANYYKEQGETLLKELYHKLDTDCSFILSLLVDLYRKTLEKIEKAGYNVFLGKHEMNNYDIFKTTYRNALLHSFGKTKIFRFGLSLLSKYLTRRIESVVPTSLSKINK